MRASIFGSGFLLIEISEQFGARLGEIDKPTPRTKQHPHFFGAAEFADKLDQKQKLGLLLAEIDSARSRA